MPNYFLENALQHNFITRVSTSKPGTWPVVAAGGGNSASPVPSASTQTIYLKGTFINNKHQYTITASGSPILSISQTAVNGKPGILAWEPYNPATPAQGFTFPASATQDNGTPATLPRLRLFCPLSQQVVQTYTNALTPSPINNMPQQDWYLGLEAGQPQKLSLSGATRSPYGGARLTFTATGVPANTQFNLRFMGVPYSDLSNATLYYQTNPGTTIVLSSDAHGSLTATLDIPIIPEKPTPADLNGHVTVFLEGTTYDVWAITTVASNIFFFGS